MGFSDSHRGPSAPSHSKDTMPSSEVFLSCKQASGPAALRASPDFWTSVLEVQSSVLDGSAVPLLSQVTILSSFPLARSLPLLLRASLYLPPADHSSSFPGTSGWQDPWRPPFHADLTLHDDCSPSASGELPITAFFLLFQLRFAKSDSSFQARHGIGCWPTFAQT